jgi:ERCC4-type nuclease
VPAKIPVVIDTREQEGHAWEFNTDHFSPISKKLNTGDYSILGYEDIITVERKTLGDAVSSLIHDWNRFRRCLYRMAGMDHAIVVIEASIEDVLGKKYESDAEPLAVLGKLNAITIDHGIPVVFAGSRLVAVTFAERFLIQCFKKCS